MRIQAGSDKPIGEILLEIGAVEDAALKGALDLQSDLQKELFSDKAAFLETTEPFDRLDAASLAQICETMEWKQFATGELVQKEGTPGEFSLS